MLLDGALARAIDYEYTVPAGASPLNRLTWGPFNLTLSQGCRVYAVCYRGCGEGDRHGGALAGLGLGRDGVAECAAYSLSEEEAHAGGFRGHAPVFAGEERVEDTWKVLNRDSYSVIVDCKRQGGLGDVGLVMRIDRELIDYDRDALTATG